MISEEMELSKDEMAEVVGAAGGCLVVAIACTGTFGVPDFEIAVVLELIY
ncbi:MAG TPA: hypothetical protein VK186_13115 [Candidatus Deferrimicrobium sp.]|nr:hypothetical protein [Candidatus Kapabacteria bacterium]HLP59773.1 hypothetical protein [Candidatus Deferrimicrobium sp.]